MLILNKKRVLADSCKKQYEQPVSRVLYEAVIFLGPLSPEDSSGLPPGKGRAAPFQAVRLAAPASLFGLAPDGVYTDAPCCQRTGELLPRLFTLTLAGGCFLLHFPWGHPRQPLAVILALRSPDFPHAPHSCGARDRMGCSYGFITYIRTDWPWIRT